jgi:hypothetical protein
VKLLISLDVNSLNIDHKDDLRPIAGGLQYCERVGRLWLLSRKSIFQGRLKDGLAIRRLSFIDDDRYDTKKLEAELVKQMKMEREAAAARNYENPHSANSGSDNGHDDRNNDALPPLSPQPVDGSAPDHDFHAHHDRLVHADEDLLQHLQYFHNLNHGQHHVHSQEGNLQQILGNTQHAEVERQMDDIENHKSMNTAHKLVKDDFITAVTSGNEFWCFLAAMHVE